MDSYQVLEWGKPLQHVRSATPQPTGTEVLVRVTACGVCHSDIHMRDGSYDLGFGKAVNLNDIGIHLPLTLGHEIVGRVAALGPQADAVIGSTASSIPWIGCGACRHCLRGAELDCETPAFARNARAGGYSDHVVVPHARYVLPYDGIDPLVAASAACSGLTAYSALKKLPACSPDDVVVIVGAGGLGLSALGIVRQLTQARIAVVDANPEKLDLARPLADLVLDIRDADAGQVLRTFAAGGATAVVDFVGLPQTFEWGVAALRKGGSLIEVGLFGGGVSLSLPLLPMRNLKIMGSYVGSLAEFKELLALLRKPGVTTVPLLQRPSARSTKCSTDIRQGKVPGRVMAVI
jgi:D-arabinose 1-dehydrogenase-like Zn-dependent alcohol dehydrogenase